MSYAWDPCPARCDFWGCRWCAPDCLSHPPLRGPVDPHLVEKVSEAIGRAFARVETEIRPAAYRIAGPDWRYASGWPPPKRVPL